VTRFFFITSKGPCMKPKLPATLMGILALGIAPITASAADELVVTSLGGVWEKATRECFVKPYEQKTGKKALVVLGTSAQWVNQVAANPAKPPIDLLLVSPDVVIENIKRGLVQPITAEKVPVLKDMEPTMLKIGQGHGVVVGYSSMGLAYNTKTVKNPPKTWQEFVDRTAKGEWEAGVQGMKQGSTPSTVLWMFAQLYGGSPDNIEPGFAAIKKMKAGGHMRVWNDMNEFLNLMKTGEMDIGMYWEGRTWSFHDSGNPEIAFIKPKPGVAIHSTLAQVPKNANPEVWTFVNTMLQADNNACWGNVMQYGVLNAKVKYAPNVVDRITKVNEMLVPPYEQIAPKTQAWVERWNKEIEN
jgi:putative spermidine/putrescine transport system substrate-binding protein